MMQGISGYIKKEIEAHALLMQLTAEQCEPAIAAVAEQLLSTILQGNTIMLCGNGGSAADAQHIATELSGRFRKERRGLPAIALTTDTSALTAIGNDYGFEYIFARQVEALAKSGDVLIGISTSGNSANVVKAMEEAKAKGCITIGMTGEGKSSISQLSDVSISIPSRDTARIQEMHILVGHILCGWIEENL